MAAMSFFGFGKKDSLQDELFNLKFASKQLAKDSKKADKEMHKEKDKVKKALEAGREDIAQIHASNAIMHKNTSKNYLMMSSRIEAVSAKLNAAIKNQQVTGSMAQITKTMGKVLKTMSLSDIQKTMDKFEKGHVSPPKLSGPGSKGSSSFFNLLMGLQGANDCVKVELTTISSPRIASSRFSTYPSSFFFFIFLSYSSIACSLSLVSLLLPLFFPYIVSLVICFFPSSSSFDVHHSVTITLFSTSITICFNLPVRCNW